MLNKKWLNRRLFSKILMTTSTLVSTEFVSTSAAHDFNPAAHMAHNQVFRGNWTENFKTKVGTVIHTPTYVKLGKTQAFNLVLQNQKLNRFNLLNTLVLRTDLTRIEFIQALENAGIYTSPAARKVQAAIQKTQKVAAKKAKKLKPAFKKLKK